MLSWIPLQSRYTVEIEVRDTARVVFDEASYEVNEDAGTVDVTFGFEDGVMLADNLEVTVNYGVSVQDAGTATAGEDYDPGDQGLCCPDRGEYASDRSHTDS